MGTTRGRPRPPSAETLETERKTLELRRAGVSFPQIATQLQTPESTIRGAYKRAMTRTLIEPAADIRDLEADRLDRLQAAIWAKAMQGNLLAVDRVLRIMERRAELLGLDHSHGIAERALALEQGKAEMVLRAFLASLESLDLDDVRRRQVMTAFLSGIEKAEVVP